MKNIAWLLSALSGASLTGCSGEGDASPLPIESGGGKAPGSGGLANGSGGSEDGSGGFVGGSGGGDATPGTCDDGIMNQDEIAVDCGGSCAVCAPGMETCADGIRNQDEVDIDCGGVCDACPSMEETCEDGSRNQDESDIDCGGICEACIDGSTCNAGYDCLSDTCSAGICASPVIEGDECTSSTECRTDLWPEAYAEYGTSLDCESHRGDMLCMCGDTPCREIYATPTCSDGELNQGETGVDCGGPCAACAPSCNDNVKNQDETDVDCGGDICGPCSAGLTCQVDADCASNECSSKTCQSNAEGGSITGETRMWHKLTISWDGPNSSETGTPNPFLDYRLQVKFTGPSGQIYDVPGYWAADGNAGNSNATSGNVWRVHFAPDEAGSWSYLASFRDGQSNIAVSDAVSAGNGAGYMDGASGVFNVSATNKTGRDMRAKGMLRYVDEHYLQFAGNKEYFLKQGPDAPENFLAYEDFDGDFKTDGKNDHLIKSWSPHVKDWKSGDPTWDGGKGKGMIGAINYLASEGLNSFSFLPMNINGDDKNVFPYLDYNERYRMDVSRLEQWEIVFAHGTEQGMFLHFKTQETENELLLDGGDLGVQRKLYYRELIARFGHHPALNWNLGEEINSASTAQKKSWAEYFWKHDPYQHHIVIHNMGEPHYDMLGHANDGGSYVTGFSLQTNQANFSDVHSKVLDYIDRSADAGKPWAVACDEPGDASHALRPVGDTGDSWTDGRKNALWGTFMAGGYGNEWYFGYQHDESDLSCEDFRSRDGFWDYSRYALEFFRNNNVPYWQMSTDNSLSTANNDYCFAKTGDTYVVYLKNGGTTNLNLNGQSGSYQVKWYDPRSGGSLKNGSVTNVDGGGNRGLGNAPNNGDQDWVILVRRN